MTTASNVARLSALHPETGDERQRRRRAAQTPLRKAADEASSCTYALDRRRLPCFEPFM